MTFYIKNHRGEYIDIDNPNLKWERPAPAHVDPNCATCGNTIMAHGITFKIIDGVRVCNVCEANPLARAGAGIMKGTK